MSPVQRPLSGPALSFSLHDEMQTVRTELAKVSERIGRTLLKNGPLRVTLIGLKPGGALHEHRADGPITVQVLEGSVRFQAAGQSWPLSQGSLLTLGNGEEHRVESESGALFLLTVVAHAADGHTADRHTDGRSAN